MADHRPFRNNARTEQFFGVKGHQPWEKGPTESSKSYEAFLRYRDMGVGRSLLEVSKERKCSLSNITKWSMRYVWVSRIRAWENEQERLRFEALKAEGAKVAKKHAQMAGAHLAVLMAPIRELARRIEAGEMEMSALTEKQLLGLAHRSGAILKPLVEVERLSHGLPSQHVAQSGPDGGPVQSQTVIDVVRRLHQVDEEET